MSDIDAVRSHIEDDPYCAALGIDLVALEPGSATTRLEIGEGLTNFHGSAHGGAIYSLADAAFAAASNSRGETALALETTVSYLEAVEIGTVLESTARETHVGGRTAAYEVDVTDGDDDRVATFRGRVYRP